MAKKTIQRTIRFDEDTITKMDALCAAIQMEAPKLIRALVDAAHRYYEDRGVIYLPIEVRPIEEVGKSAAGKRKAS